MKKMLKPCLAICMLIILSACGQNADDTTENKLLKTQPETSAQKVVVFSARKQHLIEPLFTAFTEETGIEVNYITDKAQPLLARISASKAQPEADVFMAVDAGNLWSAAQQGLLQPANSQTLTTRVPATFRDQHGLWFGLSKRARTIVYSTERVKPEALSTYAQLGDPKWKGRLCLRTSQKVYNQSLVAMMLEQYSEHDIIQILQSWVENLAVPVFSSDTLLIQAIAAGQCDVGIVNTYYLAQELVQNKELPVAIYWANQASQGVHMNISGAGIVAGAPHKPEAVALLNWLVSDQAQAQFAGLNYEFPVVDGIAVDPLVESWGLLSEDARPIESAGKNQAQAIKIMDKAGYR